MMTIMENMKKEGKYKLDHIGWIAGYFFASIIITMLSCPFAGPSTGEAVLIIHGFVFLSHAFAAILSLHVPKVTRKSIILIGLICLAPALFFTGYAIKEGVYHHLYGARDRFHDYLGDPVPSGVGNLKFLSFEEAVKSHLAFRFDIDPGSLKEIITAKGFNKTKAADLKCPSDLFKDPEYLPLAGEYVFYQGVDEYGNVLSLKVNKAHTHAIFRCEDAEFYISKEWNSQTHQDALAELERRKIAKQKDQSDQK